VSVIERRILRVRGCKVLLDADLAALYGVETRALVQAVKRNASRFPPDFMFRLDASETRRLRSQIVISNRRPRGGRRHAPYVFTEQGVAMLSSVLKSPRAIESNIQIMRAFVRLRELMVSHASLLRKLDAMERKYDERFKVVFEAIRTLMTPTTNSRRRQIGFRM
jgi:ORF6N domain-containing protein